MEKLLFGTRAQAEAYADISGYTTDPKPVPVGLSGFEGMEGAPDTFSGETNALVARDEDYQVQAYLAYWDETDDYTPGIRSDEYDKPIVTSIVKNIRITPEQEAFLLANFKNVTQGISHCINKEMEDIEGKESYRAVIKASKKEVMNLFTRNEWLFLFDSLNGTLTTGNLRYSARALVIHNEDAELYDHLAPKWGVDLEELNRKTLNLAAAQVDAVYTIAEEFWNDERRDLLLQCADQKAVRIWIDSGYIPGPSKVKKLRDLKDVKLGDVDPLMGEGKNKELE